jgi:hypothetical protein
VLLAMAKLFRNKDFKVTLCGEFNLLDYFFIKKLPWSFFSAPESGGSDTPTKIEKQRHTNKFPIANEKHPQIKIWVLELHLIYCCDVIQTMVTAIYAYFDCTFIPQKFNISFFDSIIFENMGFEWRSLQAST